MATRKNKTGGAAKDKPRPRPSASARTLAPPSPGAEKAESGRPGGGQGRVDATGVVNEDVRIDPDIMEGQPGYDESGDSEMRPSKSSPQTSAS
jgi:hypothetical protein